MVSDDVDMCMRTTRGTERVLSDFTHHPLLIHTAIVTTSLVVILPIGMLVIYIGLAFIYGFVSFLFHLSTFPVNIHTID